MALLLRDGYDTGTPIADDPVVWVFDDFVTVNERRHIIDLAAPRASDALVSRLGTNSASDRRTGQVAWVKHNETATIRGLVRRVGDLVGVHPLHAENLQVVHYAATQEYKPHYDAWDIETPKGKEKTNRGGNRAVTALMYLNEVGGGGGTAFPKLDVEIEAVPGRLVIFHNLYEGASARHRDTLHGGLPVTDGEKWACNLWFRERRYQRADGTSSRTGGGQSRSRGSGRKRRR